jgi:hypothetical protein
MCFDLDDRYTREYTGLVLKLSTKGNTFMLKLALRYVRYAIVTLTTIGFALTSN